MERKQVHSYDRLGKYELLERLGQGGMGEVWKARDTQLQRYVAIKLLRAEMQDEADFVSYFMREARLVAALRHPNIVQIHDFQPGGVQGRGGQAYMVMDYIEGGTLAGAMRGTVAKGLFWSANDIVELFTAISLALDYAHGQGMIHRDIKPANILLDRSLPGNSTLGRPVLTDFGIARWQGGSSTLTGFVGTPLYISPEQAQSRPVDARSDLYSLGIVLYEVLTGRTPYHGNNPLSIILQHVEEQPPLPSSLNSLVSPALTAVVLKSIAKDPRERFASATAMTIALAQAFAVPVPTQLESSRGNSTPVVGYNPLQPSSSQAHPASPSASSASNMSVARGDQEAQSPFVSPAREAGRMTPTAGEAMRQTPAANFAAPPYTQPQQPFAGSPRPQGVPTQNIWTPQPAGTPYPPFPARPPALPQPGTDRQRGLFARRWVLVVSLVCVVGLLGAGVIVGTRFFSTFGSGTPAPTAHSQVVGQLLFLSSASAPKGTFNEAQIDVRNVPLLPGGLVYYAWLIQANREALSTHWKLQVANGAIHDLYASPSPQTNIFASSDTLLITGEDGTVPPVVPYTSPARHYYYALITHSATASLAFAIRTCPTSNVNSATNPCR